MGPPPLEVDGPIIRLILLSSCFRSLIDLTDAVESDGKDIVESGSVSSLLVRLPRHVPAPTPLLLPPTTDSRDKEAVARLDLGKEEGHTHEDEDKEEEEDDNSGGRGSNSDDDDVDKEVAEDGGNGIVVAGEMVVVIVVVVVVVVVVVTSSFLLLALRFFFVGWGGCVPAGDLKYARSNGGSRGRAPLFL